MSNFVPWFQKFFLKIFFTKERASREAKKKSLDQGINCVPCDGEFGVIFLKKKLCIIKRLLDSVFMISGIIKVMHSKCKVMHSKCYQPRSSTWLITLTLTLIIPDVTKTSYNNCLKSAPHQITLTPGGGPEGLPCPPFPPPLP